MQWLINVTSKHAHLLLKCSLVLVHRLETTSVALIIELWIMLRICSTETWVSFKAELILQLLLKLIISYILSLFEPFTSIRTSPEVSESGRHTSFTLWRKVLFLVQISWRGIPSLSYHEFEVINIFLLLGLANIAMSKSWLIQELLLMMSGCHVVWILRVTFRVVGNHLNAWFEGHHTAITSQHRFNRGEVYIVIDLYLEIRGSQNAIFLGNF
jgi:hypothetical protein